jgi:AAA+ ATPase superfamily predicted ATPase
VRELKDSSALAPYVQKLSELRLIRIVRSLDATERERDRRYYLDDPFLAFWYRFYLPNLSPLAAGHLEEVWRHTIEPRLDDYMGGMFEWICRDYARRFANEVLPTAAQEVGQIWAGDFDIDVAGRLLNGEAFAGECKWWSGPVGMNVLQRLRETANRPAYERDAAKRYLLLFSRSGFTPDLKRERKRDPDLRLIGPDELLGRTPARRPRRTRNGG